MARRPHGEERDQQDAVHGAECDLARDAETEDEQHHGIERDLRQRIKRDQDGLADGPRKPVRPHPDTDRKADAVGEQQREEQFDGRSRKIGDEPRRRHGVHQIGHGRDWRRQSGLARDPMQDLPDRDEGDQNDQGVGSSPRRGHVRPPDRRSAQRMSKACSAALTIVAMIRSSRISAYMRRLLKSA